MARIEGTPNDDTLVGTSAPDQIFGLAGNDLILNAFGGDDFLNGGPGNDTSFGGDGDDGVFAGRDDDGDDLSVGGDGNDEVGVGPGNDIAIGDFHVGPTTIGSLGDGGSNSLYLGDGDDLGILGGYENLAADVSYEAARDFGIIDFVSGTAAGTIWAGAGADILYGGAGGDVLGTGTGDDQAYGGGGADTIYGGPDAGNDSLDAGAGDDVVYGGGGEDVILGDEGNDLIVTGFGADAAGGGLGDDTIYGGRDASDDGLFGDAGDDELWGGAGNDAIGGGDGSDHIVGGPGDDTMSGGAGSDTFKVYSNAGADRITDFTVSGSDADLVDLTAFFPGRFSSAEDVIASMRDTADGALLDIAFDQYIIFEGLTVEDFNTASADIFNISGTPEPGPGTGGSFTLTTDRDVFVGSGADNVFDAPLGGLAGLRPTYQAFDELDGGGGTDRLNATLLPTGSVGGDVETPLAGQTTDIERLFFTVSDGGPLILQNGDFSPVSVLDMQRVSGAEEIWNNLSAADLGLANVQNPVTLGVRGTAEATGVQYAAGAVPLDYEQTVVLEGAGTIGNSPFTREGFAEIGVAAGGAVTGLNIVSAGGENFVNIPAVSIGSVSGVNDLRTITDLTVSGSAPLVLSAEGAYGGNDTIEGNDFTELETLDASEHTGGLFIDMAGQTSEGVQLDIALGEGFDDIAISDNAAYQAPKIVDAGGDDFLLVYFDGGATTPGDLDFSNVSGMENLVLYRKDNQFDIPGVVDPVEVNVGNSDFATVTLAANLAVSGELVVQGSSDIGVVNVLGDVGPFENKTLGVNNGPSNGTVTLDGFSESLTLNIDDGQAFPLPIGGDAAVEEVSGSSFKVNLATPGVVDGVLNVGPDLTVEIGAFNAPELVDLTVNLGAGSRYEPVASGDNSALETFTVTGGADTGFAQAFTTNEANLSTIDLSGMAGTSTVGVERDDASIGPFGVIDVLIGAGDVNYGVVLDGSDIPYFGEMSSNREVFSFVGDNIGDVIIGDEFESGIGANKDRLDFSAFEGVDSAEDFDIEYDGEDSTITSEAFDGSITVKEVDLSQEPDTFIF